MNTLATNLSSDPTLVPRKWGLRDLGIGLIAGLGAAFATQRYSSFMDIYELVILWACVPSVMFLGYLWAALRPYLIGCAALAIGAVMMYGGTSSAAETNLLLKYFLSSQSAILWMCALFSLATIAYWVGLLAKGATALWMGSLLTWSASVMGFVGLLVRWYESYLISPDVGHIPVSNLYEVFILFSVMTALFYLYYEGRYKTRALGGFVLLIISAAVGFLLWYIGARSAHEIQPLVPALQSWWMKIHVPANFVGYGTFSLAAMVGFAYLIKENAHTRSTWKLCPAGLFLGVFVVCRAACISSLWIARLLGLVLWYFSGSYRRNYRLAPSYR